MFYGTILYSDLLLNVHVYSINVAQNVVASNYTIRNTNYNGHKLINFFATIITTVAQIYTNKKRYWHGSVLLHILCKV